MRRRKGTAHILLIFVFILFVVWLGSSNIKVASGIMTELIPNIDDQSYEVFYQKPIDVSTYKTSRHILNIHSVNVAHEYISINSDCSSSDIKLMTPDGTELGYRGSIYENTNYPRARISLDADIMTEHYIGTDTIDIYAMIPIICTNDKVPSLTYMTMRLNDMEINYDPIECQLSSDCDDNKIETSDTCIDYRCDHEPVTASTVEHHTQDVLLDLSEDTTYHDYIDADKYDTETDYDYIHTPIDQARDILSYIQLWVSVQLNL